jgi:hypothetical protein
MARSRNSLATPPVTGRGMVGTRTGGSIPPQPGTRVSSGYHGLLTNPSAMKTGKHPAPAGLNTSRGTLSNPGSMKTTGRQGR